MSGIKPLLNLSAFPTMLQGCLPLVLGILQVAIPTLKLICTKSGKEMLADEHKYDLRIGISLIFQ